MFPRRERERLARHRVVALRPRLHVSSRNARIQSSRFLSFSEEKPPVESFTDPSTAVTGAGCVYLASLPQSHARRFRPSGRFRVLSPFISDRTQLTDWTFSSLSPPSKRKPQCLCVPSFQSLSTLRSSASLRSFHWLRGRQRSSTYSLHEKRVLFSLFLAARRFPEQLCRLAPLGLSVEEPRPLLVVPPPSSSLAPLSFVHCLCPLSVFVLTPFLSIRGLPALHTERRAQTACLPHQDDGESGFVAGPA